MLETVVLSKIQELVLAEKQKVTIDIISQDDGGEYLGKFREGDVVEFDNHQDQYRIVDIEEDSSLTLEKLSSPHGTGLTTDVPAETVIRKVSEGLLTENDQRGSLYSLNDRIDFEGGARDKRHSKMYKYH